MILSLLMLIFYIWYIPRRFKKKKLKRMIRQAQSQEGFSKQEYLNWLKEKGKV